MRVGEGDQAALRARRLLARSDTDYTSQARCHLVLGTISRDTGLLDQAKTHYDRAVSLADLDRNLEQLCLAQMRMLTLRVWGADWTSDSILPALERNVRKTGDPLLAAALRTCAAEIDTRTGHTDRARSALVSARRLLRDSPNVFLEGNAAIAGLCLSLFCSDWNSAIEEGLRALRCAGESGNLRTELAARLNLGQVFLNQGRVDDAERHLDEALRLCPRGGNAEIGVLDALAQASLARGHIGQCEDWLRRIRCGARDPQPSSRVQPALGTADQAVPARARGQMARSRRPGDAGRRVDSGSRRHLSRHPTDAGEGRYLPRHRPCRRSAPNPARCHGSSGHDAP